MANVHPLLKKQLQKYQKGEQAPAWFTDFLAAVSDSYDQFEHEAESRQIKCDEKTSELIETNQQLWHTLDTANSRFKEMENMKTAMLNLLEDERSLEESLREERDRIKAIISSVGEGLIVVDRYFQIMIMNPVAQQELGVVASEVIGKDVREVITSFRGGQPIPESERPISIAITTGKNVDIGLNGNLLFQSVSGKRFPVSLVVTPLRNESGKEIVGLVIVFRNITAEKKFDEAKSSFISIASHQLRTPLTPLRWFSEMLLNGEMGPLNEKQKELMSDIHKSVDRMISLINFLLQIARIETGRVKIEPKPLDLAATTHEVVASLAAALKEKPHTVTITSVPEELPKISMDKDVFWQVIQNLLTNAIRYSPEGSTITVSLSLANGFVQASVQDQGIGIPKDQQSRVFEKFYRAPNAFKLVPEGTGLGLSLVKSLVTDWGGKVWFETEEGKGTTFYFTIPQAGMQPREGEVTLAV